MEEASNIAALTAEGFCASTVAVADQLEIVGCSLDVTSFCLFKHQVANGFRIRRVKVKLRQHKLNAQIVIGELLLREELVEDVELISAVQGEKA